MKKTTSWKAIFIGLICFFPIGIYLLIKKVVEDDGSYRQNGNALIILALVLLCMIPVLVILTLTGELQYSDGTSAYGVTFIMAILLIVGSTISFMMGIHCLKRGQKYDQSISQLTPQHPVELKDLVSAVNLPINTVINDIQRMIDAGYIPNAYIDHIRLQVSIKPVLRVTQQVICSACGGSNQVEPGKPATCEYCNTTL